VITGDEARAIAERALREMEDRTGDKLAIWDGQFGVAPIEDHGDVWTVNWNSEAYLASGEFFDQILSGPIVVPKDGRPYFYLGTYSPSVDVMLEDWRAAVAP
jgi:hypothetical protein